MLPKSMWVLGLVALCGSGCASTAVSRYHDFAQAGHAYTAVFDTLAFEASRVAVRFDSKVLVWGRKDLPRPDRLRELSKHTEAMEERLALTADLRRHARLLADYFSTLDALASTDAPTTAATAAAQLGDTLASVGSHLSRRGIGDAGTFTSLLGPLTKIVVGGVRKSELKRELQLRSATLSRELALQRAAVRALADQLQADLKAEASREGTELIARPYVGQGDLPTNWVDLRWQVLTSQTDTGLGERASRAVKRMELTFAQLVSGKAGKAEMEELVEELEEVAHLLQAVQAH